MAKKEDLPKYEKAYLYWINDYNGLRTNTDVAIEFGVSSSAVGNWRKKYKWDDRYKEEFKQFNEELKRQLNERVLGGCEYFLRGVDTIWTKYVTQICTGERKITDEAMYNLQILATEIQRGKYISNDGKRAETKSDALLADLFDKLGGAFMDVDK